MAGSGTPDFVAHATPPQPGLAHDQPVDLRQRLKELNAIGIALSQQQDTGTLVEHILDAAKRLTRADAGTLYLYDKERQLLRFELLRNDTLQLTVGGNCGKPIDLAPVARTVRTARGG